MNELHGCTLDGFLFFIITTMTPKKKISGEADYKKVMATIDTLMRKGSKNLSKAELAKIRRLALLAQEYEQNKFVIEPPTI
jgi:HTH-type transcriptional regulator/antitoxin HigA